ncbi:pentatricopeptide repeat-containing protein At1g74630-like [Selaginella moellendorffii]|uniref:pentatricopeptide repeat-containing protein At1g74630-like n=1 Tax=Selaginella moellendorffii TaxID=88036 RepID=UPI000D1CEF86|nr:pentatricopeptide repeat-containing protein At1g74630-like [Selaginella moellendorffii]|eukprot:XP_024526565.1 pentatricopeptide repeat-containing protein At1g74630-like [Selaginella moellendorffii]
METQVLGTRNLHEALDRLAQSDAALDPASYGALLKECGNARELALGKLVHSHIAKHGSSDRDTFLGNFLVHMYGRCGSIDDARRVFDRIRLRNVFSSNIMIAAFTENGDLASAKNLFDRSTVKNTVTWNAMINAYVGAGAMEEAKDLFKAMPVRDVVSWSAMIKANAGRGDLEMAILLFKLMDLDGVRPNRVAFMCVLEVCADLEAITLGITIHELIREAGLESETKIANTLIHMYGSCGSIQKASEIFELMPHKSTVSWNSIVSAYAWSGDLDQAQRLFDRMPSATWCRGIRCSWRISRTGMAIELWSCSWRWIPRCKTRSHS